MGNGNFLKDIAGLGESLNKLLTVLEKGMGKIWKPTAIRKESQAEADAINTISSAISDASVKHKVSISYGKGPLTIQSRQQGALPIPIETTLGDRTAARIESQEQQRQLNMESIATVAASELSQIDDVSSELPDDDWIARFFDYSKDVSDEHVQYLWGRILSREIQQPRTFSVRTLNFLRNLSRSEAELIEKLAPYAVRHERDFIIWDNHDDWLYQHGDIVSDEIILAGEIGVLYQGSLGITLFKESRDEEILVNQYFELRVDRKGINCQPFHNVWKFTSVAVELLNLLSPSTVNLGYLQMIRSNIQRSISGLDITIVNTKSGEKLANPVTGAPTVP